MAPRCGWEHAFIGQRQKDVPAQAENQADDHQHGVAGGEMRLNHRGRHKQD